MNKSFMELVRFYCYPITQPFVELSGSEAHHLSSVRRLTPGDRVELFDGRGTVATATIKDANNKRISLHVDEIKIHPKPPQTQIVIAVSIAKGHRFDWLIEKCTELGVGRISPVIFERTVKQPKNPHITRRWNNLAIAAAKQSRRVFIPQIDDPKALIVVLNTLKKELPQGRFLLGSPSSDVPLVIDQPLSRNGVIAIVGPEGGLTEQEQTFLKENGVQPVRFADTILRIETAAVAFAAILVAQQLRSQNPTNNLPS
ncbi:MAG: 16S rRNA (uracil(1498)-N(3))-methyltransferase [Sedimentisphaerales bacterium]|nr:16S rRNA (uracil(1498)-N(3))-methyltransferase [Sedimentisphaerales bacterium]